MADRVTVTSHGAGAATVTARPAAGVAASGGTAQLVLVHPARTKRRRFTITRVPRLARRAIGATLELLPDIDVREIIPLWPGTPPGGEGVNLTLRSTERSPEPSRFHLRALSGVARPSVCVFSPLSPGGTALLIMPGGGYRELSVDTAFAAANRFAEAGVTSFVLLYRLPHEGWRAPAQVPLQDALRAMRVASGWKIDEPNPTQAEASSSKP